MHDALRLGLAEGAQQQRQVAHVAGDEPHVVRRLPEHVLEESGVGREVVDGDVVARLQQVAHDVRANEAPCLR